MRHPMVHFVRIAERSESVLGHFRRTPVLGHSRRTPVLFGTPLGPILTVHALSRGGPDGPAGPSMAGPIFVLRHF